MSETEHRYNKLGWKKKRTCSREISQCFHSKNNCWSNRMMIWHLKSTLAENAAQRCKTQSTDDTTLSLSTAIINHVQQEQNNYRNNHKPVVQSDNRVIGRYIVRQIDRQIDRLVDRQELRKRDVFLATPAIPNQLVRNSKNIMPYISQGLGDPVKKK